MSSAFDTTRCDISSIERITPIAPLCCDLLPPPSIDITPDIKDIVIPPIVPPPPDIFEFLETYGAQVNWFITNQINTQVTTLISQQIANSTIDLEGGCGIELTSTDSGTTKIDSHIVILGDSSYIQVSSSPSCSYHISFDCTPLHINAGSCINVTGNCSTGWTIGMASSCSAPVSSSSMSVVTGVTCNGNGTITVTTATIKVLV